MVTIIEQGANGERILSVVREWIDALSRQEYDVIGQALGYALAFGEPREIAIRRRIESYRSPEFFPGVEQFSVSNWRTAQGGNTEHKQRVTFLKPNGVGMVAAVEFDLPLNGKWSDLQADFVLFQNPHPEGGYCLGLEEISSWRQAQREETE